MYGASKVSALRTATTVIFSIALLQALAIVALHRTFPAVPSISRSALESLLVPLLPLARSGGRFRATIFRRKWLFWPLTRARRWLLRVRARVARVRPSVLYVNATDGTFERVLASDLPSQSASAVRYVAVSDTHLLHDDLALPPGDVLIHCGDILVEDRGGAGSSTRGEALLESFNAWLGQHGEVFRHRLVTGGNHDRTLHDLGTASARKLLDNGTYMNDESIHLSFGDGRGGGSSHHIYASAASRGNHAGGNDAFQYTSDDAAEATWAKVPSGVDVLVTHGPPNGILDGPESNAGCPVLLRRVREGIKPKVHVFGHWHDSPGSTKVGETVHINAATVDFDYAASNSPVVFDLVLG